MSGTVLSWKAPFFKTGLEGSFAVYQWSAMFTSGLNAVQSKSPTARIRRSRERESTGGEIPWGEVLVISEVGNDFLQRLVLGDVHIEALFTLVAPFINHLGSQ